MANLENIVNRIAKFFPFLSFWFFPFTSKPARKSNEWRVRGSSFVYWARDRVKKKAREINFLRDSRRNG